MITNGPWGNGNHGYSQWNPSGIAGGQVMFGPSSFRPMTYQQAYGQNQQPSAQNNDAIDWGSMFGQGGQAPTANVTTGITAGPIYNQGQVAGALGRYGAMKPKTNNPTANALYGQYSSQARLGTDRSMSQANTQHQLASETARAGAGMRWGQQAMQNSASNDALQLQRNNQVMTLLRALGGF
jgi:hypothetical protein